MMLCDVPLHPRTRSTKGPDCPNDIQKRLRSPRQHLDDRQHSINPLPKRPAIDQRTEFVRLVRIHELFRLDTLPLMLRSSLACGQLLQKSSRKSVATNIGTGRILLLQGGKIDGDINFFRNLAAFHLNRRRQGVAAYMVTTQE